MKPEDYLGKYRAANGQVAGAGMMLRAQSARARSSPRSWSTTADQHYMRSSWQTGQRIEAHVEERTLRDGRKQYLQHGKVAGIQTPRAKIIGTQGILFDITDRRVGGGKIHEMNAQLEEWVAQRTAELETGQQGNWMRSTYSVSHDLAARPLRAINGFSEMVLEDYGASLLPEKGQHFLQVIREDALRMGEC